MTKPETIEELCDYVAEHCHEIAVRVEIDGKWDSYFLDELPPDKAILHAMRFIKLRQVPGLVVKVDTDPKGVLRE